MNIRNIVNIVENKYLITISGSCLLKNKLEKHYTIKMAIYTYNNLSVVEKYITNWIYFAYGILIRFPRVHVSIDTLSCLSLQSDNDYELDFYGFSYLPRPTRDDSLYIRYINYEFATHKVIEKYGTNYAEAKQQIHELLYRTRMIDI